MRQDQPAGDDVAVEALTIIIGNTTGSMPDIARQVIAAIRRGEAPGLYDEAAVKAEKSAMYAAGFRDQRAIADGYADKAAAELVAAKNLHAQDVERLVEASGQHAIVKGGWAGAILRAERAEDERDAAIKAKNEAEGERDRMAKAVGECRETLGDIIHMGENWSSITRPLDQLVGRCKATWQSINATMAGEKP